MLLALLAGCVVGAPPGFSPGEAWTFPLVDPLAHVPLITPVMIHGKGPFLFILDPDAETGIDVGVIPHIPTVGNGPMYAPLTDVQIGSLHVDSLPFIPRTSHAFNTDGRWIAGVIGKEVITSGLVFGFDRDRGIAWLATPKHATRPLGSRSFSYWTRKGSGRGPMVTASVDGRDHDLHVDLGRMMSRLRERFWTGLDVVDDPRTIVLDDSERHDTSRTATAKRVAVGSVERFGVTFAPFVDRRTIPQDLDGTLGLDVFWGFAMDVDFTDHRIDVAPRAEVEPAARIARWSSSCKHPGCAELLLHGKDLEVVPEHTPAELVVRAKARDGGPLPDLEVNLADGARRFAVELDDRYAEATLEVIDASPFPRTCRAATECVVPMGD
jgi:hypothetical protein